MPAICSPGRSLVRLPDKIRLLAVAESNPTNRRLLRRAGCRPVTQQRAGHQSRVVINIIRSICRHIFRAFRWRGRLFTGNARCGRVAGIFRGQALLEILISSSRLRSSRASWKEGETEQTEGDFNFHGAENVIQLRAYNYYNSARNSKNFFSLTKTGSKSGPAWQWLPGATACVRWSSPHPGLNAPARWVRPGFAG